FPHASSDAHVALQPSPSLVFPSSQTSPGSTTPSPHTTGRHAPAWHAPCAVIEDEHVSPSDFPTQAAASTAAARPSRVQTSPIGQATSPHGTRRSPRHPQAHVVSTSQRNSSRITELLVSSRVSYVLAVGLSRRIISSTTGSTSRDRRGFDRPRGSMRTR